MTTFKTYLMQHAIARRDPAGDFINDARDVIRAHRDWGVGPFPTENTWRAVNDHLERHNACEAAVKAGRRVWKRYREWQRRHNV